MRTTRTCGLAPACIDAEKAGMLHVTGSARAFDRTWGVCDTMCHMKTISLRELHEQTGQGVRQSAEGEIYITDRGCLVAKMMPVKPLPQRPFFADPTYTRAFLRHRSAFRGGTDATESISQERDHEVSKHFGIEGKNVIEALPKKK